MNHFVNVAGESLFFEAAGLLARHGTSAADEADRLAARSRNDGNLIRFCRWRDVRRMIALLAAGESAGTVH